MKGIKKLLSIGLAVLLVGMSACFSACNKVDDEK